MRTYSARCLEDALLYVIEKQTYASLIGNYAQIAQSLLVGVQHKVDWFEQRLEGLLRTLEGQLQLPAQIPALHINRPRRKEKSHIREKIYQEVRPQQKHLGGVVNERLERYDDFRRTQTDVDRLIEIMEDGSGVRVLAGPNGVGFSKKQNFNHNLNLRTYSEKLRADQYIQKLHIQDEDLTNYAVGLLPEKCFKSEEHIRILHFGGSEAKAQGIKNLRQVQKFSSPKYERLC